MVERQLQVIRKPLVTEEPKGITRHLGYLSTLYLDSVTTIYQLLAETQLEVLDEKGIPLSRTDLRTYLLDLPAAEWPRVRLETRTHAFRDLTALENYHENFLEEFHMIASTIRLTIDNFGARIYATEKTIGMQQTVIEIAEVLGPKRRRGMSGSMSFLGIAALFIPVTALFMCVAILIPLTSPWASILFFAGLLLPIIGIFLLMISTEKKRVSTKYRRNIDSIWEKYSILITLVSNVITAVATALLTVWLQ